MTKIRIFSKAETLALAVIFVILVSVFVPNIMASLRRSRDQVRRDDLGVMVHFVDEYFVDLGVFPPSSSDGKIMDCLKPGDAPYKDKKGQWVIDAIPCEWGKDAFLNLITGKTYISTLPRDPEWQEGVEYYYLSDGARYQLFAAMEGEDEAEVDSRIVDKNYPCGNRVCNVGRTYGCEIPKTLQECEEEAAALLKK